MQPRHGTGNARFHVPWFRVFMEFRALGTNRLKRGMGNNDWF